MNVKRSKINFVLLLLVLFPALVVSFSNCSQPEFGRSGLVSESGNGEGYPGMRSLKLSSDSPVVPPSTQMLVRAEGGVGGYRFRLFSGPGSIDPATGVYTAPDLPGGEAVIHAVDTDGNWGELRLRIEFPVGAKPNTTLLPGTAAGDRFGFSGQTAGEFTIVGSYQEDNGGAADSGAAYVYGYNGSNWVLQSKLSASTPKVNDAFGISTAVSSEGIALVGAQGDDEKGAGAGAAYIYSRQAGAWQLAQRITAPDGQADDRFGRAVAIAGDLAVVGAFRDDDGCADCGALYVYRNDGQAWVFETKLVSSAKSIAQNFGQVISIQGNRIIAGAPANSETGLKAGAAFVFANDGTGWREEARLLPPQPLRAEDEFGLSVAIHGETAVVGSWGDDGEALNAGAVHVFRFVDGAWKHREKILSHRAIQNNFFGRTVALDDRLLVIGSAFEGTATGASSGALYVLVRDGEQWIEHDRHEAPANGRKFGSFVSVWNNRVAVGAYSSDFNGAESGAAFTFDISRK